MRIIHAIDPETSTRARVHIGCDEYADLFIDFLIHNGMAAAITEDEQMPQRSPEEMQVVNQLMEAFNQALKARTLH